MLACNKHHTLQPLPIPTLGFACQLLQFFLFKDLYSDKNQAYILIYTSQMKIFFIQWPVFCIKSRGFPDLCLPNCIMKVYKCLPSSGQYTSCERFVNNYSHLWSTDIPIDPQILSNHGHCVKNRTVD